MSYNNYVDADAAWRAAHDHGDRPRSRSSSTPTRAGSRSAPTSRRRTARRTPDDPVSAFGGVIATNREVSVAMAEQVAEVFTEVVLAPSYAPEALEILTRKKNVRLLRLPGRGGARRRRVAADLRRVLLQQRDLVDAPGDDPAGWTLATGDPVPDDVLADLAFAWRACRAVKSNAILLASGGAAVGIGMGQVNRVDSARLAVARAGDRARGSVAASDAFFPFPDGLEVLLEAGVRAVVQPGGSVRDDLIDRGRGGRGRADVPDGDAALRPLSVPCRARAHRAVLGHTVQDVPGLAEVCTAESRVRTG